MYPMQERPLNARTVVQILEYWPIISNLEAVDLISISWLGPTDGAGHLKEDCWSPNDCSISVLFLGKLL